MPLGNGLNFIKTLINKLMSNEHFIESDDIDGTWLSPIKSEREWQEQKLVEIFGHYPNASPRWQYMNGLIHIALKYIEQNKEEE